MSSRGVDWAKAEKFCFNEWSNPDDDELGLQIVRVSLCIIGDALLMETKGTKAYAIKYSLRYPKLSCWDQICAAFDSILSEKTAAKMQLCWLRLTQINFG